MLHSLVLWKKVLSEKKVWKRLQQSRGEHRSRMKTGQPCVDTPENRAAGSQREQIYLDQPEMLTSDSRFLQALSAFFWERQCEPILHISFAAY